MSEQTNGKPAGEDKGKGNEADEWTFATAEAGRAAGPKLATQELSWVTDEGGATTYCWARNTQQAIATVALAKGWKAGRVGNDPKAKVAALMSQLSAAGRAALLAELTGGTTAPT